LGGYLTSTTSNLMLIGASGVEGFKH